MALTALSAARSRGASRRARWRGRIAHELQSQPGDLVGYKVRFTDKGSADNLVKVMTDGILLAETQTDPLLRQYDTIIIDEAHERSLNIDFLLGYLKQLLPKRPDLKVIITSATIDATRFANHFSSRGASRRARWRGAYCTRAAVAAGRSGGLQGALHRQGQCGQSD